MRERERSDPVSTDLGLLRGLSRRPRATSGPGGGFASTGGSTGAPFDFSFFLNDFSFLSFSGFVGASSCGFTAEGTLSFSLSLSFSAVSAAELAGFVLEAGERGAGVLSTCF